jgi:small subunit ribosomal protein S20
MQDAERLVHARSSWFNSRQKIIPTRKCKGWMGFFALTSRLVWLASSALYKTTNEFMPNTKSAERRVRNSQRKNLQNSSVKSKLRRLEKQFRAAVAAGKKDEAAKLLPGVHSAYDKAVKTGVVPRPTANRKKSRLAVSLK